MFYLYWWNGFEYEFSMSVDKLAVLKHMMEHKVWLQFDMCYVAW